MHKGFEETAVFWWRTHRNAAVSFAEQTEEANGGNEIDLVKFHQNRYDKTE